jgi:hypothetical protein
MARVARVIAGGSVTSLASDAGFVGFDILGP